MSRIKLIGKVTSRFSAIYPSMIISEVLIDVWNEVLSECADSEIINACKQYLSSGERFAPSPGGILELIDEARYGEKIDYTPQMIVDIVRAHNTIIGVLCRGKNLVSFDLDNLGEPYLRGRAELVIVEELPEVLEKIETGRFTDGELDQLKQYRVDPLKEVSIQAAKVIAITQQSMLAIDPPTKKEVLKHHSSGLTPIEMFKEKRRKLNV